MLRQIKFIILSLVVCLSCERYSKDQVLSDATTSDAQEVLNYLNNLIEQDQNNPQIYFKRAQIYFELADYRRAGIDVQKAIEINSKDADLYLLQSRIYDKKGEAASAISTALQAESRGLKNYMLYKILAVNYLKLDEPSKAKEVLNRLLDFNKNGDNYALQGDILLELNDTLMAISSYKMAIEMQPLLAKSYDTLRNVYTNKADWQKAEYYVDAYLMQDSLNSKFLIYKAQLLNNRKEPDSAFVYYKKANVIANGSSEQKFEFAKALFEKAYYDSLFNLINNYALLDTARLTTKLLIARALDKTLNYDSAINIYQVIISEDSTMNIAITELDILKRKVAYLWRLRQQEKAFDSIRNSPPPVIERKEFLN